MQAGVGRQLITPRVGGDLVGYARRDGPSTGVHDDLWARALVLDDGMTTLVLCSVEMCYLPMTTVRAIRDVAAQQIPIPAQNILIATTHTHSGPAADDEANWDAPLAEIVAAAIIAAYHDRQPAQIGIGAGLLMGYSLNRRWLDRPVDPAVGVIRVDALDGRVLALVAQFACHAVVMGHNNRLISGDWPGYASRRLEARFPDATALFMQGGAGDVNPLTETIRQRLEHGHTVGTIGGVTSYYGAYNTNDPHHWDTEDRSSGTFVECETLARAFTREVMRVWRHIDLKPDTKLWVEQVSVDASLDEDEPAPAQASSFMKRLLPDAVPGAIYLPIMLAGIGDVVLAAHPGESFSETAVAFRQRCQQMGYRYAMLITYANGTAGYMPPPGVFAEGGYEVDWPRAMGISRHVQTRIAAAIEPVLRQHLPW